MNETGVEISMQPAELRPYAELTRPEQIQAQLAVCHEGISVQMISSFVGAPPEEIQADIDALGLKPLTKRDNVLLQLDRTTAELQKEQSEFDAVMNTHPELRTLKVWEIPKHVAYEKYSYAKKGVERARSKIGGLNGKINTSPAEELDQPDLVEGRPKYGIIEGEKTLTALHVDPVSAETRLTDVLLEQWSDMDELMTADA